MPGGERIRYVARSAETGSRWCCLLPINGAAQYREDAAVGTVVRASRRGSLTESAVIGRFSASVMCARTFWDGGSVPGRFNPPTMAPG